MCIRDRGGAWSSSSSAPWFSAQGIWGLGFSDDGRRALVVGRASGTSLRGTVLEYRHDLYDQAEFTDVSVPNFDQPPYNATSNTYLYDVAWRPGCDGGLLVGGEGTSGQLIEFSLEGGVPCR